jgi:hypothetical protein
MIHVAEFRLELLELGFFENKETYHWALFEFAGRVRYPFNIYF